VALTKNELLSRIARFADPTRSDSEVAEEFGLPLRDRDRWDLHRARTNVTRADAARIERILYRPYDWRWLYNDPNLVARPNSRVLDHLRRPNMALLAGRQGEATGPEWDHAWVANCPTDQNVFRRGGATVFPLYLYPDPAGLGLTGTVREPNVDAEAVRHIAASLGLSWSADGSGDLIMTLGPDDLLNYLYSILCSPTYRQRYEEYLGTGFPKVPFTTNLTLFRELVELGRILQGLHTLDRAVVPTPRSRYPVRGNDTVEAGHPTYVAPGSVDPTTGAPAAEGRVYLSSRHPRLGTDAQYFEGVPEGSWRFHVGGFDPLSEWLKDRRGVRLTGADLEHYQYVVEATEQVARVCWAIDAAIDANGGWPVR